MKNKILLSAILFAMLLICLDLFDIQPVRAETTICGQYIRRINKDTFGTEWEYYSFVTDDNKAFGIGLPSEGYYLIHDPVIDWTSYTMSDGYHFDGSISSWTSYDHIRGLQDCGQAPTQPPPPIPTNTYIPPTVYIPPNWTPIPPTLPPQLPVPTPLRPTLPRVPMPEPVLPTGIYPDLKQNVGDPNVDWPIDIYDHNTAPEDNIDRWGCALTDIANLLGYYGAKEINPRVLNIWLKNTKGYCVTSKCFGGVDWQQAASYPSKQHPVMEHVTPMSWDNPAGMQAAAKQSLSNKWPVILSLCLKWGPNQCEKSHYVVAVGVRQTSTGDVYDIKDPDTRSNIAELSASDQRITGAQFYQPPDGKPRSSLSVEAHSPIAYVLIDSQDRKLGYDPVLHQKYWEIPNGDYSYNAPLWSFAQPSSTKKVGESLDAFVPDAVAGNYRLIVYGTGNGPYEIETSYTDLQNQTSQSRISGTIHTGDTIEYGIKLGDGSVDIGPNVPGLNAFSPDEGFGALLLVIVLCAGAIAIPVIGSRARRNAAIAPAAYASLVDRTGSRIRVTSTQFIIGRSSGCNLQLADSRVSRRHAQLKYTSGRWHIQDMQSTGGTYVNGARVNAATLQNGDRIRIGSTEFEFRR